MSKLPVGVSRMMSQRARRMHHYLFHQTRNMWLVWDEDTKDEIRFLGWEPPRPARELDGEGGFKTVLDNDSGEDFLYMHRQMIASVNQKLADLADPNYRQIEGWSVLPRPGDSDFPVPPAWDTGNPGFDSFLNAVKSDDYFSQNFEVWEARFTDLGQLANMTLGEMGARLEFSIHNMMHMRWCREMEVRPDVDPETPNQIDPAWDNEAYDWLGDTYSSHVNPVFWKIHGWIDDRIDDWMAAHGLTGNVPWKGTWVGKMPGHPMPDSLHAMLASTAGHDKAAGQAVHDHMSEMEQVAKVILKSGKFCHFYDDVQVE